MSRLGMATSKVNGWLTPVRNCMKLKNGTHISAGRNCCAKTVYTGEVIHVIYNEVRLRSA